MCQSSPDAQEELKEALWRLGRRLVTRRREWGGGAPGLWRQRQRRSAGEEEGSVSSREGGEDRLQGGRGKKTFEVSTDYEPGGRDPGGKGWGPKE